MRRKGAMFLLAMLSVGMSRAQSVAGPVNEAPSLVSDLTSTSGLPLPDAPSSVSAAAPQEEVHLPRSFQPVWSVSRSHVPDKLSYGLGSLVSLRNVVEVFAIGGFPYIGGAPHQPLLLPGEDPAVYQQAMDGYGHAMDGWLHKTDANLRFHAYRYEVGLATVETRQLLGSLVLPLALHQEGRYRPAPIDATFDQRMANAAEAIVVTHDDHGRLVPNYSKLISTFTAAYLGSHEYATLFKAPELNNSRFMLKYAGYSLLGDVATNMTREAFRAAVAPDLEVYALHGRSTEDSYYPMSAGAKVVYWARSAYAPRVFVQAFLTASLFSVADLPKEPVYNSNAAVYDAEYTAYGEAIAAWRQNLETTARYHARRLYAGLATVETQQMIQNLAVPVGFGIDPRYIPLGKGYDSGQRLSHTFTSLVEARTDSGGHTVNLPVLLGTFGSAILAKELYYPQLGTPALAGTRMFVTTISLNLAADVVGNMWSEFVHHRGY